MRHDHSLAGTEEHRRGGRWHSWGTAGLVYLALVAVWALAGAWISRVGIVTASLGLFLDVLSGFPLRDISGRWLLMGLPTGAVVMLPVLGYLRSGRRLWLVAEAVMVLGAILLGRLMLSVCSANF